MREKCDEEEDALYVGVRGRDDGWVGRSYEVMMVYIIYSG